MTMFNGYVSLAEFKAYITPQGQALNADAADDAMIESIIERASRRLDDLTLRTFYPHVESHNFDVPEDECLWFSDDLLEVITLTNGDATTIAAADYVFKPANESPKYCLLIRDTSTVLFTTNSSNSGQQVIALNAIWGYHNNYSKRGWIAGSQLDEGSNITAAVTNFTVDSGTPFKTNQLVRVDNEILLVNYVSSNEIYVTERGYNGSTAAVHLDNAPVYYWQPMQDIVQLTLEIARMMYRSRYGENVETTSITTPAGVVINPRSLPVWARELIDKYKRVVW